MRNLQEYPITSDDVYGALKRAEMRVEGEIGGIDQLVLRLISDYFVDHKTASFDFDEYLEERMNND